jgi:V-type H+-transporting ATPase subunit C
MPQFLVVAGPDKTARDAKGLSEFLSVVDPPNMKCGGFESQFLSTDSLAKLDSTVEQVLRRIERAVTEADKDNTVSSDYRGDVPLAVKAGEEREFKVGGGRSWVSITDWLKQFKWDDTKFGMSTVQETAQQIQKMAESVDGSFRSETQAYTEKKQAFAEVETPEGQADASYATRALVEVFKPDVNVREAGGEPHPDDDFIYTKHLTTVVVVVPKGGEEAFKQFYDGAAEKEKVVPESQRRLNAPADKDGATLHRVLVMKDGENHFVKSCREAGFVTSDFKYLGKVGHAALMEKRKDFKTSFCAAHQQLLEKGLTNWSELFQCWIHLKILRAAVEGNLRYGSIPCFAILNLPNEAGALRKKLPGILGTAKEQAMQDAEVEDHFPYVSVTVQA